MDTDLPPDAADHGPRTDDDTDPFAAVGDPADGPGADSDSADELVDAVGGPGDDPADELVDDDPPVAGRRRSTLTRLLVGGLLVAAGFVAGAAVQKAAQTSAGIPVLTGTVQNVSGNVLEVADSSGSIVAVTVPDTANVSTLGLTTLTLGTPVTITGDRSSDGGVIASGVTARPVRR